MVLSLQFESIALAALIVNQNQGKDNEHLSSLALTQMKQV